MARPLNKAQKTQAEGRESPQRTLDAILDLMTSDVISSEQMRESAMALVYFEPKILAEIDRIGAATTNQRHASFVSHCCSGSPYVLWGCSREVAVCRSYVAMIFARACRWYQNTRTGKHVLKCRIYVMAAEV